VRVAREPSGGYDFPAKDKYRWLVWGAFAEYLDNVSMAKIVFFPGKKGLEIPIALSLGFREENLIAVDNSAALLASAKWRSKYPLVRIYGNELSRAVERMKADGVSVNAANLDFCNALSDESIGQFLSFIHGGVLKWGGVVSVTMLRGRDSAGILALARKIKIPPLLSDSPLRPSILFSLSDIKGESRPVRHGFYKSTAGKQVMDWLVCRIMSDLDIDGERRLADRLRADIIHNFSETRDFWRATELATHARYHRPIEKFNKLRKMAFEYKERFDKKLDRECIKGHFIGDIAGDLSDREWSKERRADRYTKHAEFIKDVKEYGYEFTPTRSKYAGLAKQDQT
jgi:hypothetical protein